MNPQEYYVYEITYDIDDQYRNDHERWLPKTTERWITTAGLDGFECEQSVLDESPEIRLRLGFETLADWGAFVESEPFEERFERLQTMTKHVTARLWEPTAIGLDPTADGGVPITAGDAGGMK